jgi:deoxyribodipyrimidine photo-lyase
VSVSQGDLPAPPPSPDGVAVRWPRTDVERLREDLSVLPIDHTVAPVATAGGAAAGRRRFEVFVERDLARYGEDRNHPDEEVCSGLSPYLHFGHVSSHEVVARVLDHGGWTPDRITHTVNGAKTGWWGLAPAYEAFLDQIVTWRELGFNMADRRSGFERYDALPAWAMATLERHASDPRPYTYSLDQFSSARTHDPVWNAAQRQLVSEGRIHNYLRMLWGKKILEWTATPRYALDVMIELNNRWALDGRDPNSYSGILWVLGRYDRPWPERPIFGTVRYMTSDSTVRKLRTRDYLRRYGTSLLAGI